MRLLRDRACPSQHTSVQIAHQAVVQSPRRRVLNGCEHADDCGRTAGSRYVLPAMQHHQVDSSTSRVQW